MRKTFAIALIGIFIAALPSLAVDIPVVDDADHIMGSGEPGGRVDCAGTVVYDTGMYDEFVPPPGVPTSGSAGCFVNALNEYALGEHDRRMADDWPAFTTDPIDHIKTWARYNDAGYDYHINEGGLHGYCVVFYSEPDFLCPDGSVPGVDALGEILYDEYSDCFVEEEIFTGLDRNFNQCVDLPVPFVPPAPEAIYWVTVTADFDMTVTDIGLTQWFWRMITGSYDPLCEGAWYDAWNDPPTNWQPISVALDVPGWAGWNCSLVLYTGEPATAVEETTWGQVKTDFR